MITTINNTNINKNIDLFFTDINSKIKNYNIHMSDNNIDAVFNKFYCITDFIIVDNMIYNLYKNYIEKYKHFYVLDVNENNKNMNTVLNIIDKLNILNFSKKNNIIVMGGGITQDIGGFVSTIFKRGVNWILIPTTLLCMIDSCIGSKLCLNHSSKNMLGLFNPPNKIFLSTYFLSTLSNNDITSGLGEAIKLSLIGGENCFQLFKKYYSDNNYLDIIRLTLFIKKIIIELDEFELNERKSLNYGHTIGHALESASNYSIPHGIAVIFGMYIENILLYDNLHDDLNKYIYSFIDKSFFNIKLNNDLLLNHLINDKKNDNNNICFIGLKNIGNIEYIFISVDKIKDKLFYILNSIFIL